MEFDSAVMPVPENRCDSDRDLGSQQLWGDKGGRRGNGSEGAREAVLPAVFSFH